MVRRYSLTAVVAMAVSFVAGAAVGPTRATLAPERKADDAKPPVVVGHRTAVFNMAAVMRDFHQAKYRVWLLNNKKAEISKELLGWRNEYIQLQQELQRNPAQPDKDKAEKMRALARKIEDEDRKINQQLNDDASAIIGELYDMIGAVVTRTAEREGYKLVLAYPDAVTPEEKNSTTVKELKLKPPAAQPFYVSPDIDITAQVVRTLNDKHPPIDAKTKEPVDVTTLAAPAPLPAPGPVVPAGGVRP